MKKNLLLTMIMVAASVLSSLAQTATVNLSSNKQYIRGFGGMNHPEWAGDLTAAQRSTAFGNGDGQLGFSILRIYINDNSSSWSQAVPTALAAQKMGVTIFATPWNPPASMTETVTRNNRSEKRLKYASYDAYAKHLVSFNNYMKGQGVNLYAMSFANEPDYGYDWTWYSADEVYNFTKNYASQLRVNNTKVISAESFSYQKSYYTSILNDASALKNLDIIGTHFYGSSASTDTSFFHFPLADQKAPAMERWMTEHYTSSDATNTSTVRADVWPEALDVAYEIHRAMVEGNFSAYVWWYIRRAYGPIKEDGTISKRGYCMGQFSKFIRPGFVRIDATKNPTYNVYVSAYKKDNSVVIVAVNRSTDAKTLSFSIPNSGIATWSRYVTSGTKNLNKEADVKASSNTFQVTLDAQSVTTFTGSSATNETVPTVKLTAPAHDTSMVAPANINLVTAASVTNGSVAKVEFYNGATKLGEASSAPYTYSWKAVPAGTYRVYAVVTDNTGKKATSDTVSMTVNVPQTPYLGTAAAIPGTIQAENFDLGGEGFAYHDADTANSGKAYRTSEGVDIKGDEADGYRIGWTVAGEWMEYTVNVAEAAVYNWSARVATTNNQAAFHLQLDGADITPVTKATNTGDWVVYDTIGGKTSTLAAGQHVLKLLVDSSYFDIDWLKFSQIDPSGIGVVKASTAYLPAGTYQVYNIIGVRIGSLALAAGESANRALLRLTSVPGIYVLRGPDAVYKLYLK